MKLISGLASDEGDAMKRRVFLLGLPSTRLQLLAGQLNACYPEIPEIRELWDGRPHEDAAPSEQWIASKLAESIGGSNGGVILLAYTSPAAFVAHRLRRAAESRLEPEELERFVKTSLEFWRTYHTAMLEQYRRHEDRALLLNADHAIDVEALLGRMKVLFGLPSAPRHIADATAIGANVDMPRASLFHIVDALAPECLELYAELESCAELIGREPEFDFTGPEERQTHSRDLLHFLTQQARMEQVLAGYGVESVDFVEGLEILLKRLDKSIAIADARGQELAVLQKQASVMQKERDEARQQHQQLTSETVAKEKENKSVQQEKEVLLLQLNKLEKERDEARQQHQQLSGKSAESEKARKALQQEKESLLGQLEKLKQERDQVTQQYHQLNNKTAGNEKEKKSLQEENELLLLQLHQVQEELEHYYLLHQSTGQQHGVESTRPDAASASQEPGMNGRDLEDTGLPNSVSVLRAAGSWFGLAGKHKKALRQNAQLLRQSGYFDEAWYREQYPDVAQAGLDPIEHYLEVGVSRGLNPSPRFDTRWYLQSYPDVAQAKMNPLLHFLKFGKDEGRQPRP
jgi:hypothetical protein